ncbi:MAG: bifunctional UDP-N-acetylglucosamine diphosphorylase/glucosamine-1-phosphate N-acetyltransferase GlmU [Gammaproteobacteria bacterium]|nr:bifunctional UDP-N-acetylglucosamine diphosphorylase/glucosamine-1-phosphate N-acetyltransferase GlmU [Gammaproteobacteria bacterium]
MSVVILAAGQGSRMKSNLPKVLHTLADKSLLGHVLETSKKLNAEKTCVVIGHGAKKVKTAFAGAGLLWVEQQEQKGTGHAVQQALPQLQDEDTVLVLYGDVPLTRQQTLQNLIEVVDDSTVGLLTVTLADATGYGRIVRDAQNQVSRIVEQKDASAEEQQICEVNTGILAIKALHLKNLLSAIGCDNAQGEYYLTDIFALARKQGLAIATTSPEEEHEVVGVNNRRQLAELERIHQREIADQLLDEGVTLRDPTRLDVRGRLQVGRDVMIDVNVLFEGEVILADGVQIGANCVIRNTKIGTGTVIKENSVIDQSEVASECVIGPFARLRPGTQLSTDVHVGNFVELKNSIVAPHSKINHLSYVGDSDIGSRVNIGAGTITCNYDGANKHRTVIGDDVFVGSDTQLVAPVTVERGVTIGAGTTVTENIEAGMLVISRVKQKVIGGWQRPKKPLKKEN